MADPARACGPRGRGRGSPSRRRAARRSPRSAGRRGSSAARRTGRPRGPVSGRSRGRRARGEGAVEIEQRQARQAARGGHEREGPAVRRRVGIAGAQPAGDADLAPAAEIPGPDVVERAPRRARSPAWCSRGGAPSGLQASVAPEERRREGVPDEAPPSRAVGVHDPDARVVVAVGAQPRDAAPVRRPGRGEPLKRPSSVSGREGVSPRAATARCLLRKRVAQRCRPLAPEVAILRRRGRRRPVDVDQEGQRRARRRPG